MTMRDRVNLIRRVQGPQGDGDRHAARAPVGGERGGHLHPAAVGAEGDEPADKDGQL